MSLKPEIPTEIQDAVKKIEEWQHEQEIRSAAVASKEPKGVGMVYSLINYSGGLIKSERQAEVTLFTFSILLILVSLHMFMNTNAKNHSIPVNLPTPFSEGRL